MKQNRNKGRPVLNEKEKDIREKFKEVLKKQSPAALRVVVEIMNDPTNRAWDRLRAAEFILKHTFGEDFVVLEQEQNQSDRTLEVRLISVCGRKKQENETKQSGESLINLEDEKEWNAGNKEIEMYDPSDWDVDEDFEEDN